MRVLESVLPAASLTSHVKLPTNSATSSLDRVFWYVADTVFVRICMSLIEPWTHLYPILSPSD
jgi:hypothetical protein